MSRVDESYQTLLTDNNSGSSDILKSTFEWLYHTLELHDQHESQILLKLDALCKAHPCMALLQNFYAFFRTGQLTLPRVDAWMEMYQTHDESACHQFAVHLSNFTNILVHSYSGMLLESLKSVPNTLNIYCTESRPIFEGRRLAERLAETHHKVYLITDMAAFSVLPRVELTAFGCDAITPRGIVNKIGTAPLAESAQRQGRMNCFIGTSEKLLEDWNDDFLLRQGSREEIYTGNLMVQVENYYFDLTPPPCVGGLFLETGLQGYFDDAKTAVSGR
jgi:translation initiation factor 2B subunit (eIF-2B alpha/beta/delta family)